MVRHLRTRYFLHLAHGMHAAVIMGIMPLIGLLCATWAAVAYGATTSVTLGVGPTSIVVDGKTSPSSFVTILDGTSVVGTTVADASGTFSKKISAVSPGIHHLRVYARDPQNRLTDTIQIEMSAIEHFQTNVYLFLPPTLVADRAVINPGQSIVYRGSTYPNATVTLLFNNDQNYQINTDPQGQWTHTIDTSDLPLGTYEAFAQATDNDTGEQSYASRKVAVTITQPTPEPVPSNQQPTPQPSTPSKLSKPRTLRPTTIQPPQNNPTAEPTIDLGGTAEPLAQVEIFNGGRPIGSTFANKKGSWTLRLSLQDLEYSLRARACIRTACSDFSDTVQLFYRPAATSLFTAWLDQYAYVLPVHSPVSIHPHINNGSEPFTITTEWGDGTKETIQQRLQDFTLQHTYKHAGQYSGTITLTDPNNTSIVIMFSVLVTADTSANVWPGAFISLMCVILIGIGAVCCVYMRLHYHKRKH